jgi:glycosyltransferase involved in cell wall biosynthesis
MRVAVDASRCTVAHPTGTEHYALQLIRHLITANDALPRPHQITLYFRDAPAAGLFPSSPNVQQRVIPFPRLWTHLRFAAALFRDHPDVTFVPAHTLPFVFPGRAMVTVHDLGYVWFPQAHRLPQRLYLDLTTRWSARRADLILADSAATRADLTRVYQTPADKVHVVYPGVEPPLIQPVDLQQRYSIPQRYFLFLGTLQPRKNIARLVAAHQRYRQHTNDDAALVLAGSRGWLYDARWTQGAEGVIVTGYVEEAHKGALLAEAVALVMPSLYEGFGFPVLEAMHCGTPVIASRTSSLPELVGEAGLLVDPLNVDEIAQAMQRVTDPAVRKQLTAAGRAQAQRFSWESSAQRVLALLDQ